MKGHRADKHTDESYSNPISLDIIRDKEDLIILVAWDYEQLGESWIESMEAGVDQDEWVAK